MVAGLGYQNTHQTEIAGFGCCASTLNVYDPVYGRPITTPAPSFQFDNGMAPYVSYSTSFEPQLSSDKNGDILPPTLGKQVEIGLKYQPNIWDSLFTLSGYDLKETNVATGDPSTGGLTSIAAGEVESLGLEFEGSAHPLPGLDLRGSYTYLYISSCYATLRCWYGSGRDAQATLRYRW